MKVLIFTDYFAPGYRAGGQIRVIENLLRQPSSSSSFELRVVTTDRDIGDQSAYPDIETSRWVQFHSGQVRYLAPSLRSLTKLVALIREEAPDVIHLNSAFSSKFTLPLLTARKLGLISPQIRMVVSPHGEFATSALSLKSKKKSLFLSVARATGLYSNLTWHATSAHEKTDIEAQDFGGEIRMIAPPVQAVESITRSSATKARGTLRLIFLSRICEIKNLDFLLRILKTYPHPVTLDIFGPIAEADQPYWKRCESEIQALPKAIQVTYQGTVEAEKVTEILQNYDLFVSPTLGENFGFTILESLASGCPVLISDRTPWTYFLTTAGQALPLDDESAWHRALAQSQVMSAEEWLAASQASRKLIADLIANQTPFTNLYAR